MAKKKWYKSKGGWIGAFSYFFLIILTSDSGFADLIGYPVQFVFDTFICRSGGLECLGQAFIFGIPLILAFGFLIGYFIEKKFFKKKRTRVKGRRVGRR